MDKVLELFLTDRGYDEAEALLARSRRVWLRHNDDNGEWMWAVEAEANREFWFNAFLTRSEAMRWCDEAGLTVVGFEDESAKDRTWPQVEYDENAQNPARARCLEGGEG